MRTLLAAVGFAAVVLGAMPAEAMFCACHPPGCPLMAPVKEATCFRTLHACQEHVAKHGGSCFVGPIVPGPPMPGERRLPLGQR